MKMDRVNIVRAPPLEAWLDANVAPEMVADMAVTGAMLGGEPIML